MIHARRRFKQLCGIRSPERIAANAALIFAVSSAFTAAEPDETSIEYSSSAKCSPHPPARIRGSGFRATLPPAKSSSSVDDHARPAHPAHSTSALPYPKCQSAPSPPFHLRRPRKKRLRAPPAGSEFHCRRVFAIGKYHPFFILRAHANTLPQTPRLHRTQRLRLGANRVCRRLQFARRFLRASRPQRIQIQSAAQHCFTFPARRCAPASPICDSSIPVPKRIAIPALQNRCKRRRPPESHSQLAAKDSASPFLPIQKAGFPTPPPPESAARDRTGFCRKRLRIISRQTRRNAHRSQLSLQ